MRIVFDHQIFQTQTYGGISRYVVEVARRLARMPGNEVQIAAGLHLNGHLTDLAPELCVGRYRAADKFPQPLRRRVNKAFSYVALRALSPQVVHETYYLPKPIAPKKVPVVVTVHDMIHELMPQHFPTDSLDAIWKRKAVARADAIVCVSENTRRDLIALLPAECASKPIRVIHHGFAKPLFAATDVVAAAKLTNGKPFVLYIGTRVTYKNFGTLLTAFSKLGKENRDLNLVAFGGGNLSAGEQADISGLGLHGRIIQFGGSDGLLAALFNTAQAFVYPSLYEGFGMPILEAFAAQCPVICSSTAISREVAGDAADYFEPNDAEQLSHMISSNVMRTPSRHAAAGVRLKLFDWDKSSVLHSELYSNLL